MGDDDRVPIGRRGARQEAMAHVFGEVCLVGDQDPRRRIKRQELAGGLRQAMAGNDQHGLRDQAETALLHDRGRHRHGLAGADGVGEIGGARRDDPPDAAFLMAIKNKGARGARQLEMLPVEGSGRDIIEGIVVDPRQPVGPVGIGPDPCLEGGLDLGELFLGRLGVDDIEDPALAVPVFHRIEDLRDTVVERIGKQLAGMPALGAPFGRALGAIGQHTRIDRPGGELRHVPDRDVGSHRLLDKVDDVARRYPWRTKPRRDLGRAEIGWLHPFERLDIAAVSRVELCRGMRCGQFVAHGTGEIGVRGLP